MPDTSLVLRVALAETGAMVESGILIASLG
jgi:hypothetical protein